MKLGFPGPLAALSTRVKVDSRNILNLSSNEMFHGEALEFAARFLRQAKPEEICHYPYFPAVRDRLADSLNVPRDRILLSAGCDDAIRMVLLCLLPSFGRLVMQSPNYENYKVFAQMTGAKVVEVPHRMEGEDPFPLALTGGTALVVVANPNGFSGRSMSLGQLVHDTATGKHILVIDETYAAFSDLDHRSFLEYDHVLILKSFSKSHAAAGLRLGAVLGSSETIAYLGRWRGENAVSGLSLAFLEFCLDNQEECKELQIAISALREQTVESIAKLFPDWTVYRTTTNFLTVRLPDPAIAQAMTRELSRRDIRVRCLNDTPGYQGFLRITVADEWAMQRLVQSLIAIS